MTNPAEQLFRLGLGFAVSQALRVVIDLEIADRLASGERSVAELAAQTGSHARRVASGHARVGRRGRVSRDDARAL